MQKTVTALKIQKKNPGRVNVYLDGEFAFGLSRIVAAWLRIEQVLSEEDIHHLQEREIKEAASQAAQRLLGYKPRSAEELRQRLRRKGFAEAVVDETVARLRENGQLDDRQFAADWVENQSVFRPRGRRLLKYELHHKGVDESSIQQALETASSEEDLAYQAASRKARLLSGLEKQEYRRKLIEFLARRGFSYGTAAQVTARMWNEIHQTGAAPEDEVGS